eukprot:4057281-Heterocapsa_arctica.AAC.1
MRMLDRRLHTLSSVHTVGKGKPPEVCKLLSAGLKLSAEELLQPPSDQITRALQWPIGCEAPM